MFITEDEAKDRLKTTDNLLSRLGIDVSKDAHLIVPVEKVKEKIEDQVFIPKPIKPTFSSIGDPDRLSVLEERRETKTSDERGGRYPEQTNIPPIFRALIAGAARVGTTTNSAKTFGVSKVLVNNYKQGKIHQDDEPNPSLLSKIERDTLLIRDQVLGVLSYTIAGITPESIENKDPKELSIIARNLSSIMSSTKPPADFGDKTTNAQVIVFSPEQGKETEYDKVEIG